MSSPQPEFQHEVHKYATGGLHIEETFSGCLLLHRLLIMGREDEVLKRKEELSPSLLSHTCNFEHIYSLRFKKVSIEQFSPSDPKSTR